MRMLGALLTVLAALAALPANAQWDWDADVEVGLLRESNVFEAPTSLEVGGEMLTTDSLLKGDVALPITWSADIERVFGRHAVALDVASDLKRHGQYGQLDGDTYRAGLSYTVELADHLEAEVETEGRRSRTVGTDALGDELSRVFEYRQFSVDGEVTWMPAREHEIEFAYERRLRDYVETDGAPSLDYKDHRVEAAWAYERRYKRGRRWHDAWALEAELSYRHKRYDAYAARDVRGVQRPEAPLNALHYYGVDLEYERALSSALLGALEVGGTYRHDPYEGYYTYRGVSAGTSLEWEAAASTTIEGTVEWRGVHFSVKDAPQSGLDTQTDGAPTLRYDYFDWSVELEHDLGRALTLTVFAASAARRSNATLESLATRRSYAAAEVGLSVEIDIDRLASLIE